MIKRKIFKKKKIDGLFERYELYKIIVKQYYKYYKLILNGSIYEIDLGNNCKGVLHKSTKTNEVRVTYLDNNIPYGHNDFLGNRGFFSLEEFEFYIYHNRKKLKKIEIF